MNAPDSHAGQSPGSAVLDAHVAGGASARSPQQNRAPDADKAASDNAAGRPPQALDRWFDEQLNRLFNDVSTEPLPSDLAKLVGQLRAQGSKPEDK